MASTFSTPATKLIQPPSLNFSPTPTTNRTSRSPIKSLFHPLKNHNHKLRLNKCNSAPSHSQSTTVVAVSDTVKKPKSTPTLPNLVMPISLT